MLRQLFYMADVYTTWILVVDKTLPLVIQSIVMGMEGSLQGPKLLHDVCPTMLDIEYWWPRAQFIRSCSEEGYICT